MVLLDTGANPHRIELEYWRYFPDVIMDIIISCSLTHQVIRSHATQDNFPLTSSSAGNQSVSITKHRMVSFQNPAIATIYKHQQRTLQQLGQDLNDKELRYSGIVLATIITLMRVEVSAFLYETEQNITTHNFRSNNLLLEHGQHTSTLRELSLPNAGASNHFC